MILPRKIIFLKMNKLINEHKKISKKVLKKFAGMKK